ncbi:hypothetical protein CMI37_35245 [Candidatus Pacearchaeota archaeon]|nr:hypothetical protein [Candidatus Pacearchaeota archaeon]|tara:strand:- start:629 stop:1027 length:399 start_codon:yes stop_codon:yes gene_type:complete
MVKKKGEGSIGVSKEISSVKVKKKKMTGREREELLIENFVGLQKAMTNLSIRFENLSGQIVKLLQVFEESAKSLVGGKHEDDNEMLKKIDSLLDQNKTIAQGLVLMESKLRKRHEPEVGAIGAFKPRPLPRS